MRAKRPATLTVNKRGQKLNYIVQKRDSKQVLGFRKHFATTRLNDKTLTLCVRGNFDHLNRTPFKTKVVRLEHPQDKGYFKEARILTPSGKARLETCRKLKASGLPLWEYMHRKKPFFTK